VARTETFTLLAVCEWFNVLNCLSDRRSALSLGVLRDPWLVGGLVVGNLLQIAVIYVPALNEVFHTVPIPPEVALAIGAAGSLVLWTEELRKLLVRRREARGVLGEGAGRRPPDERAGALHRERA
jgi:Ca2+-transporting ATPase